jgi:hypothetical protein
VKITIRKSEEHLDDGGIPRKQTESEIELDGSLEEIAALGSGFSKAERLIKTVIGEDVSLLHWISESFKQAWPF